MNSPIETKSVIYDVCRSSGWRVVTAICAAMLLLPSSTHAQGPSPAAPNEITPESRAALDLGLEWLAANQGPEGNWGSNDLGLVSIGALAFLADGHMPGRGSTGYRRKRSTSFSKRCVGLINIAGSAIYNHGLSTFVLGRPRRRTTESARADRALKLIAEM
jgi:hypothetical protein